MTVTVALVHEEDGVFGVSFPDFPGCIATGRTAEDALRKGQEALNFHVAGMVDDNDPLPLQRSLSIMRADQVFQEDAYGAMVALIPVDLPGRAVRLNISMAETLVDAVDRAARHSGQSRSAFLAHAAKEHLKRQA